jgi:threonine synthase
MLYLTTRDRFDTFTAFHAIKHDTAPNGGLFLPFKMPKIDMQELAELSFGDSVALVLNRLFSTRLTGKEVEFSIGRNPIRVKSAHQRTLVAELYRNLDGSYEKMEQRLAAKICNCFDCEEKITSWICIAIRIAVLFGTFAEIRKQEMTEGTVDISVPCGDFKLPMAAWYAREMGLPIGNIICACGHNSGVWDLLRHGEMRTATQEATFTELERLICGTLGVSQAVNYHTSCEKGSIYLLQAEETQKLSRGIFCAVVSDDRVENAISSVYRTSASVLERGSAVSYSGLMDYRAKTGESRTALLLADCNPADQAAYIAGAMNITEDALKELLRNS